MKDAKRGMFSVVIIYSIDRLGRSTRHLLNLIEELRHLNVSIISLRESIDFTTPSGQMSLAVLAAVSQLESQLISERIRTALAVKRAIAMKTGNGWKCGRPSLEKGIEERVISLRAQGKSIREISKEIGSVSKSSVSRILKDVSQKLSKKE